MIKTSIIPFDKCPALDGYHCQTNSLAKIYNFYNCPLSEDMLLGLGAGMGYIYWKMKIGDGHMVFIGGRANNKNFFADIGKRTGVEIRKRSTTSRKRAEKALLDQMNKKEPLMVFGDMGFLPWFDFPEDYHFGGHTFVICGYDGGDVFLASDMDPAAAGLKKGFYHEISSDQLATARGSKFKPFPPKNTYLEFDFSGFRPLTEDDIYSSIEQTVKDMLYPPIRNLGVKGISKTAQMLPKWPKMFDDHDLRMNLFSIYIFIEIGGTGGGCFRKMYSRFLKEANGITGNDRLVEASKKLEGSGRKFSEIALLFKKAEKDGDLKERIERSCEILREIADAEEEAFKELEGAVYNYRSN